jgi:hypothetical protein
MKSLSCNLFLLFVLGSFGLAQQASADECTPGWFKKREPKKLTSKLVGYGKGSNLNEALREARRHIGAQIARRYFKKITGQKYFRSKVSINSYAPAKLRQSIGWAIGLNLKDYERLKSETLCEEMFLSIRMPRKLAINQYEGQVHFADQVQKFLLKEGDELELKRANQETEIASLENQQTTRLMALIAKIRKSLDKSNPMHSYHDYPLNGFAVKLGIEFGALEKAKFGSERKKREAAIEGITKIASPYTDGMVALLKKNYTTAHEIFSALAKTGNDWSQVTVGLFYQQGYGVKRDDSEALVWFQRAAKQGNTIAQFMLGGLTLSGRGTKQDIKESAKWFQKGLNSPWTCPIEVQVGPCSTQ